MPIVAPMVLLIPHWIAEGHPVRTREGVISMRVRELSKNKA